MRGTAAYGTFACLVFIAACRHVAGLEKKDLPGPDGSVDADADVPAEADVPEDCVAVAETCNGRDDDCDGVIDNGGVCACTDASRLAILNKIVVPGPVDDVGANPAVVWGGSEYGAAW